MTGQVDKIKILFKICAYQRSAQNFQKIPE